jgi:hypothetical protein
VLKQACLDGGFDAIHLPTLATEEQQRLHKQQAGFARIHPASAVPAAAAGQEAAAVPAAAGGGGGGGITTRTAARRRAAAATAAPDGDRDSAAAAAAAAAAGSSGSDGTSGSSSSGFQVVNTASLLLKRELSMNRQAGLSRAQQQHITCHRALPLHPQKVCGACGSVCLGVGGQPAHVLHTRTPHVCTACSDSHSQLEIQMLTGA